MNSFNYNFLITSSLFHTSIPQIVTVDPKWPSPETIGFLYSMWYTYILNMRSVQALILEISCLPDFHNLTPVEPKWPLNSTENNRVLVLNVMHLHTKYEICPSFPFLRYIMFTRFSQFVDPKWPLTYIKTIGFLYCRKPIYRLEEACQWARAYHARGGHVTSSRVLQNWYFPISVRIL